MQANPYSSFINKTISAIGLIGTENQTLPKVTGTPYIFYQYEGINQFYSCAIVTSESQSLTTSNCPQFFPNTNSATWNGESFSAYFVQNNNMLQSSILDINTCASNTAPLTYYYGQTNSGNFVSQLQCELLNNTILENYANNINWDAAIGYATAGIWYDTEAKTSTLSLNTSVVNQVYGINTEFPINVAHYPNNMITFQYILPNGLVDYFVVGTSEIPDNITGKDAYGATLYMVCNVGDIWCHQLSGTSSAQYDNNSGSNSICIGGQQLTLTTSNYQSSGGATVNIVNNGNCSY